MAVSLAASGAYLLGVALVYAACGTVSMATLGGLVDARAPAVVAVAAGMMGLGLMAKTALLPFHFWLPAAHGSASAPVSALLSALVVKASFYLLLRLAGTLYAAPPSAALLAGLLGSAAIVWGSIQALRTPRLKMLVAYSSVAQIGYLFLAFPLLGADGLALQGGVLQALSHGLAKAAQHRRPLQPAAQRSAYNRQPPGANRRHGCYIRVFAVQCGCPAVRVRGSHVL